MTNMSAGEEFSSLPPLKCHNFWGILNGDENLDWNELN